MFEQGLWAGLFALLTFAGATVASAHAVLSKKDVRAAIGWVVVIWIAPLAGAIAYLIFGVNRINRRAQSIFGERELPPVVPQGDGGGFTAGFGAVGLGRFVDSFVQRPLMDGNEVTALCTGKEAYEAMLRAIGEAERSVALATYIFDRDEAGVEFAQALQDAHRRGVEVRVLIDAVGSRYSTRSMISELRQRGVPTKGFLPTRHPLKAPYLNLRNHRKILVVDGCVGFTGGMNIREGHRRSKGSGCIRDLHFQVEGPVVEAMMDVFAQDWQFAAKEVLRGDLWFPEPEAVGQMQARAISDGPDHDIDKIQWTFVGALACAQHRARIVTPYFLPINGIDTALITAARRGVHVDLFLPSRNNLRLVHWASRGMWSRLVEGGCRLWLTPPPFDHSKLMIVDNYWSCIGSANWDPRSLRLNFEMNLEVHSPTLNRELESVTARMLQQSRRVTVEDLAARPLPVRLLDGAVGLAAPYL